MRYVARRGAPARTARYDDPVLELPLLPAMIVLLIVALGALIAGLVLGGRLGYNDRLRDELESTVEDMHRRTEEYRAARNMPPLQTFAYGHVPERQDA
jgi:hypothetical protein